MKKILLVLLLVFVLGGCNLDASINGVNNNQQNIDNSGNNNGPDADGDNKFDTDEGSVPPLVNGEGGNSNNNGNNQNPDQGGNNQGDAESVVVKKIDNLTISSVNEGYSKVGNNIEFTKAGEYVISGSFIGSLIFKVDTIESVTLYLNGANLESVANHTIYWQNTTGKIEIKAVENTVNTIAVKEDASSLFSAIESENNIEIGGSGKLTIKGAQRHAVKGSNIEIKGNVDLTIEALKDGLHGKQILISGGNTKINNCTDAIQADINSNNAKGTILVEEGYLTVNNCKRAFRAATSVTISVLAGSQIVIYIYNTSTPIECATVNYVSGTFKINGVDYK